MLLTFIAYDEMNSKTISGIVKVIRIPKCTRFVVPVESLVDGTPSPDFLKAMISKLMKSDIFLQLFFKMKASS